MTTDTLAAESSPFGDKNLPACTTPIEVKVHGQIPEWVNGVLYRVGTLLIFDPVTW
jgi:torulene dioxygenase